jgi:hypothetical protein
MKRGSCIEYKSITASFFEKLTHAQSLPSIESNTVYLGKVYKPVAPDTLETWARRLLELRSLRAPY